MRGKMARAESRMSDEGMRWPLSRPNSASEMGSGAQSVRDPPDQGVGFFAPAARMAV